MMRIGIFGGTFNPIHLGHLAIAIALKEAHYLDHVYFVPTHTNPQKQGVTAASSEHRLKMLRSALRGIADCSILTLELNRPGPSYMIDTVRELKKDKRFKEAELFLLMGEDLLQRFSEWKSPQELVQYCQPLVAKRSGAELTGDWQKDPELRDAILRGITETPLYDVSATNIRERLKNGLFCGHLVDRSVLLYIKKERLYDSI
ncbi:MAG: putative nicotinate-nucleotide adenylyltransferase [Chlamydiia bacterium]|nr:putative nicotinate-nucleotide adenylyltransferase [Chlamydiia bacterium]